MIGNPIRNVALSDIHNLARIAPVPNDINAGDIPDRAEVETVKEAPIAAVAFRPGYIH
jgi:hypothetical protein